MIQAVIFDWAGTTVDYGCFAPVQAFIEAFRQFGIEPTMEETRTPMGLLKKDHIRTMLGMERIARAWRQVYGRKAGEADVEAIYAQFEPGLLSILEQLGVRIGSTTGYTDAMMEIVAPCAARQGYAPDLWLSPDSVGGLGRPYPYMIFENMRRLGVSSVKNVLKIGDTVSDMQEGVNAGVWTAGVIEGSSALGLSEEEFSALPPEERETRCREAARRFREAGAHFVIYKKGRLQDVPF